VLRSPALARARQVLRAADVMLEARQGWNTDVSLPNAKSKGFGISLSTWNGNATEARPLFDALDTWLKAQPASMQALRPRAPTAAGGGRAQRAARRRSRAASTAAPSPGPPAGTGSNRARPSTRCTERPPRRARGE
jgi:hypothetical protein